VRGKNMRTKCYAKLPKNIGGFLHYGGIRFRAINNRCLHTYKNLSQECGKRKGCKTAGRQAQEQNIRLRKSGAGNGNVFAPRCPPR